MKKLLLFIALSPCALLAMEKEQKDPKTNPLRTLASSPQRVVRSGDQAKRSNSQATPQSGDDLAIKKRRAN